MSLEDKFDKIVREKVGEADFPFEENDWQNASRMIDAERTAAGGAKSSKLFLLFGSLFLVIAGVTFFSLMTNSSDDKAIADNRDNVTNAIVNSANTDEESKSGASSGAQPLNNETASSLNKTSENNSAVGPVSSKNSDDITSAPANSSSAIGHSTYKANANDAEMKNGGDRAAGTEPSHNAANGNAAANVNVSKKYGNSGSGLRPYSMHHSQGGKVKASLTSGAGKTGNNEIAASRLPEENLNAAANTDAVTESADYLNMHKSVLQIWNKDEALRSNGYDFIRYDEDYFVHKHRHKYYLNAEIGATYLLGWQTASGKDGAGLNGFAGVNFGIYLPKKFIVSVGAQVYNVSNITQPFYTQTRYDYDFGYTGTHTNITANSLLYASVPVKISYPLSRKSRVGAGINIGMLFSGVNTVQTYNESDLVKSNVTETKVKGYYAGVNKMNTMISAFYTYRLNRRFCVNGELMLGLSDVYKNSVTKNGTFERNMGARLSLQYDIIHR